MSDGAQWYVVHTYSGYENTVKATIEKYVENRGLQDLIHEISIPLETVTEITDNGPKEVERKVFPGYVLVKMVMTDESWYGYLAGLTADNVDKVDAAVVSEPMTGSQAYSLVLLRLKDKADAREIADSMEENISMRKWVCVEADKARVVSFDDKLLYVMADSELVDADLVADAAAKAFGATFDVDDSLVNEDESELPPELLTAPAVAD